MEYHSDRFTDFSLLIFKDKKLMAVLPANAFEDEIISHQGLTFGSLILGDNLSINEISKVFKAIKSFLKAKGFQSLSVKTIPEIYYKSPAFEFQFLLAKQAELTKRNLVMAIDYSKPLNFHKTKLKHFRKGVEFNFKIEETSSFKSFWETVLEPRLKIKFNSKPVHSLSEIEKLNKSFPKHIKQYNIYKANELLAGITIFENEHIVKSQYGATTESGEKYRALDYLFIHLIHKYMKGKKRFFSMGTVEGDNELGINEGLLKQKQELGCQIYLQDHFKVLLND